MRLLALCWAGFILVFFTFSTTQEYYSMPCYPALALLLGRRSRAGPRHCAGERKAIAVVASAGGAGDRGDSVDGARHGGSGRHRGGAESKSRVVYTAFAGTHGGPDAAGIRLFETALAVAGVAFADRRGGSVVREAGEVDTRWRVPNSRTDNHDGSVFPCGAPGVGGVRSVHGVTTAGGGAVDERPPGS